MYQVGIKHPLQATHYLVGDFEEEETQLHTHEYLVEWICTTEGLDQNGFSVDIALMEETLEGQLLNDLPFFSRQQTSVENVACFLYQRLSEEMRASGGLDPVVQAEIRIWESETAWAAFISESA
jgi:6-pyruvoyl-tetrahydropterin synthase